MDPRPLLGEPPALDLLNTHWIEDGTLHDQLATPVGVDTWLASAGYPARAPAPPEVGVALRTARDVLRTVLEGPGDPGARAALNRLLARGRRVRRLADDGRPRRLVEVDDPAWTEAWIAADNYLDLLERAPDRIRRCDHPRCVLWFFDTTRGGSRRWCSMAMCGNRAKADRHYRSRRAARAG